MNINVKLLNYTPINVAIDAIRTCWDSNDKKDTFFTCDVCGHENKDIYMATMCRCREGMLSINKLGPNDKALLNRIIHKHKHHSTIEHINFTFNISGITRACLQELARHRKASYSVMSTRYTIKKHLRDETPFDITLGDDHKRISKYVRLSDNCKVDEVIFYTMNKLIDLAKSNNSNDIIKYGITESFKTELFWTINARSLMNFLELRTSNSALKEIRILAYKVYLALPMMYKEIFFKDILLKDEISLNGEEDTVYKINKRLIYEVLDDGIAMKPQYTEIKDMLMRKIALGCSYFGKDNDKVIESIPEYLKDIFNTLQENEESPMCASDTMYQFLTCLGGLPKAD